LQTPNGTLDINQRYEYIEGNRVRRIRDNSNYGIIWDFAYDSQGRLTNDSRLYDNYGNPTRIGITNLTWERGNLLRTHGNNTYSYNYQGARFRKVIGGVASDYFLDGSKILGENRGAELRFRYIYDATGLVGIRRRVGKSGWENFTYLKDVLGNITGIVNVDKEVVCRYFYTAFGRTTIRNPDGSEATLVQMNESHISRQNPFRWKSHYFDNETNWYYIDGRYYDPAICGYVSADAPENLLANAGEVHGLNRYGISTTNAVVLLAALYTIFTSVELSWDTDYDRELTRWQRFLLWLGRASPWIRVGIIAVAVVVFIVAAVASRGKLIAPMMKIAMKGAITGFVFSALMSVLGGAESFGEVMDDAVHGALTGGAMAIIFVGIFGYKVLKAQVAAANAANTPPSIKFVSTSKTQNAAVQPKESLERVGRWMSETEFNNMQSSGFVQEGAGGVTFVARPANISAYAKQAKPGSFYVEFDVVTSSLRNTQAGWAKIIGPNSFDARFMIKKGQIPPTGMPRAYNISLVGRK